jgi:hypothetical protein
MTLRKTARRKSQRWSLAVLLVGAGLLLAQISSVMAGASSDSGFEGADGNLAVTTTGNVDWNTFASLTWTGSAPLREASGTVSGWKVTGLEDHQATTADSAFAGGTKQDDNCAKVGTGKAPNKDDLKRVYFASKTIDVGGEDHVFLGLAWVRIPQNTTSSSAHVGFEFNKGETACGTGSDGLVSRSVDDRLFVYDFEGGSANPVLKLLRWTTDTSEICEASGKAATAAGCWTLENADLTVAGSAEAKVNTSSALDTFSPTDETLATQEFGEAIIDLTDAGIFTPGACESFGSAFAVSRSSGNSAQAQMKDLVGPGEVDIQNCGSVVIRKVTSPDPDPLDTSFSYTTTGGLEDDTAPLDQFSLKNGGSQDYGSEVQAGSYSVAESNPGANYALSGIDCSASSLTNGSTIQIGADSDFDAGDTTVSFTLAAQDTIDCTYTNTLQVGALLIEKKSTKTGNPLVANAGAVFSVDGPDSGTVADFTVKDNNVPSAGTKSDADSDIGQICVSGLLSGSYTVNETTPPDGYGGASQTDVAATVTAGTNCTDNQPTAVTFTNNPLSDIQVNFRDGGSDETSATIECKPDGGSNMTPDSTTAPSGWDTSATHEDLAPGKYICTIDIDP